MRHLSFKAVGYHPLEYYLCYLMPLISLRYCSATHPPVSCGSRGERSRAAGQSCTVQSCCSCPDYRGVIYIRSARFKCSLLHWDAEGVRAASFCMVAVSQVCALNS